MTARLPLDFPLGCGREFVSIFCHRGAGHLDFPPTGRDGATLPFRRTASNSQIAAGFPQFVTNLCEADCNAGARCAIIMNGVLGATVRPLDLSVWSALIRRRETRCRFRQFP